MIVPTNGNSDASVAQNTSIGSSIRRRASANVQKTSASHTTIRTRIRTLTAVLSASLSMPKTPKVSMCWQEPYRRHRLSEEHPAESVAEGEEHQDGERHHDGHQGDHPEDAGPLVVVHSAETLRAPGAETRSAIR